MLWFKPATKGGRCRRAPQLATVWALLDTVETLYGLFCGQKRPTDLLWTKHLPVPVQARVLLGAAHGGGLAEFPHRAVVKHKP